MWLTLLAVTIGLIAGLVAGGKFKAIGQVRPVGVPLAIAWLALICMTRWGAVPFGNQLFWVANACALSFCAMNIRRIGSHILFVGMALNALVIVLNGSMPYRISAVISAELARIESDFPTTVQTRPEADGDRLLALADIVPINAGPIRDVVSVGDLIAAVGVAFVVYRATLLRPAEGQRRQRVRPTPTAASAPRRSIPTVVSGVVDVAALTAAGAAVRNETAARLVIDLTADRAAHSDRYVRSFDTSSSAKLLGLSEDFDDLDDDELLDLTDDVLPGDTFWRARADQRSYD
jgi:hypothetical protein